MAKKGIVFFPLTSEEYTSISLISEFKILFEKDFKNLFHLFTVNSKVNIQSGTLKG